ncbi:MAG: hypothetical protein IMF09_02575 [Proteobacteria bacterium]|nr:hypothetical protein [Pseudomonadota bacterium]
MYSTIYKFTKIKALLSITLLFICSTTLADSIGCNDTFVQLDPAALIIHVDPTGVDDTENIQCALDASTAAGVPTVKLGKHSYKISRLDIDDFKGAFDGTSITTTTIQVLDQSIDCAALADTNSLSAAITFHKGEPRVRFMTIQANDPCMNSSTIWSLLSFTGRPGSEPVCGNDVIFATVDRVKLIESGADKVSYPISVVNEFANGCTNNLLGTFKLNRSEIIAQRGIFLGMKSGAQVDINFNKFTLRLGLGIRMRNAYQSTTIYANEFTFVVDKTPGIDFGFIYLEASSTAPNFNRVVIHQNKFDVTDAQWGLVVYLKSHTATKVISAIITDNILSNVSNPASQDILFTRARGDGVQNGLMSGNSLGRADGIKVEGNINWTVTENLNFNQTANSQNIYLNGATSKCIIGPGQNASVTDFGVNNFIL